MAIANIINQLEPETLESRIENLENQVMNQEYEIEKLKKQIDYFIKISRNNLPMR